jgi:transcriptional regulator with XRE-family HTH domain
MARFNEDIARLLADQVKAVRKQRGMSQEDLCYAACLHRTEVGMIERGVRLPRIDTLIKIAGALGVGVGDLVDHLTWHPPGPRSGTFTVGPRRNDTPAGGAK